MNTAFKIALMLGVAATVFAVPAFAAAPPCACSNVVCSVPEPATLTMLASGIGCVVVLRHRRKK
jgi:PEP-CTERM motif